MAHGTCYACHGTKKLMGMGMMYKDCYVCDGVGHIATRTPEESSKDFPILGKPVQAKVNDDMVIAPKPTMPKIDKRSREWRNRAIKM